MNSTVTILLLVGAVALAGFWMFSDQQSELHVSQTTDEPIVLAQTTEAVKTIRITLGDFFFEGPEGRSGPQGKDGAFDEPQVVLRLKNGEPVRLIFENVSPIVDHQVVSPLFSAPEEKVFQLPHGESIEIEITPQFLSADDGGTLVFELTCHERHGQSTGHYKLGMRALIEVIP